MESARHMSAVEIVALKEVQKIFFREVCLPENFFQQRAGDVLAAMKWNADSFLAKDIHQNHVTTFSVNFLEACFLECTEKLIRLQHSQPRHAAIETFTLDVL